jgi:hypothetical protein
MVNGTKVVIDGSDSTPSIDGVYTISNVTTNSLTGYTNGTGAAAQPTPGVVGSSYLPTQDSYTALPTTGGGTGSFVTALACHPDWAKFATPLEPKIEAGRSLELQMDEVVSTWIYGSKIYRSDHAVLLHTAT